MRMTGGPSSPHSWTQITYKLAVQFQEQRSSLNFTYLLSCFYNNIFLDAFQSVFIVIYFNNLYLECRLLVLKNCYWITLQTFFIFFVCQYLCLFICLSIFFYVSVFLPRSCFFVNNFAPMDRFACFGQKNLLHKIIFCTN